MRRQWFRIKQHDEPKFTLDVRDHWTRTIKGSRSWTPVEIPCACGCGATLLDRDQQGRKRRYLPYHHSRCQGQ